MPTFLRQNPDDTITVVPAELLDDLWSFTLAELPEFYGHTAYVPPTRWQRIKHKPREIKHALLGAIHDRFFRDYCDCDY